MALAGRGRPGSHEHRPVSADLDRAKLRGGPASGHLDVRAEPDPQRGAVASVAPLRLLAAQLPVPCQLEGPVQRPLVLAAVVGPAAGRGEREVLRAEEVPAPELARIDADLGRQHVHGPLDHGGRLGPPRTAIGGDDRGVGDDARGHVVDPGDPVNAGHHHPGEGRQPRAEGRVGPRVRHHPHAQADQPAVPRGTERELLHLAAALGHVHQVLSSRLHPAHGAPKPAGQRRHDQLLRVGQHLRAEAPAHVRGDDSNEGRVHAERPGDRGPDDERSLAGGPHHQSLALGHRQHRVGLHRHRRQPLVDEGRADHHFGVGQHVLVVLAGFDPVADVGAGLWEEERSRVVQGGHRVDHRRQRLVVDLDRLGCVDGLLP